MAGEHPEEGADRMTHTVIGGHTEKHRETQGKGPREDGGRNWSYADISQGISGAPRS